MILRIFVALDCFTTLLIQKYACILDAYTASKNRLKKTVIQDEESYEINEYP
jgi:hypothetical protein